MAAARLVREVLAHAPGRFEVELVGSELAPPYDRIQLSAVLAGERRADRLGLLDPDLLARHGVRLRLGATVTGIDRAARRLALADGTRLAYDRFILATGSQPIRKPLPGRTCRACSPSATSLTWSGWPAAPTAPWSSAAGS